MSSSMASTSPDMGNEQVPIRICSVRRPQFLKRPGSGLDVGALGVLVPVHGPHMLPVFQERKLRLASVPCRQIVKQQHCPAACRQRDIARENRSAVECCSDFHPLSPVPAGVSPFVFGPHAKRERLATAHDARTCPLQLRRSAGYDLNDQVGVDGGKP